LADPHGYQLTLSANKRAKWLNDCNAEAKLLDKFYIPLEAVFKYKCK